MSRDHRLQRAVFFTQPETILKIIMVVCFCGSIRIEIELLCGALNIIDRLSRTKLHFADAPYCHLIIEL